MRTLGIGLTSALIVAGLSHRAESQVTLRAPRNEPSTANVRGEVFDSLTMAPVGNATIWLPGGTQTTTTDRNGRFELDNVPRGKQFIAFSSPGLDSLGLGTLGNQIDVLGDDIPVRLTTPSFRAVWRLLCSGAERASSSDSGIVWGTVRDANTDTRLNGATAGFSWYDMKVGSDKKFAFRELTHQARTDSSGNYYACGLPSDIRISSQATGAKSASGAIEYVIGARRLVRFDLSVSTDMVLQRSIVGLTTVDSLAAMRARGTATLRGTVRDDKGKVVSSAIITLASVDTSVRSSAAGEFTLTGLPAGSHALQARLIGLGPTSMLVDLRPGQTTTIALAMASVRALAAVNVRAERSAGNDKLAFEERRRRGAGYALMEKDFVGRYDIMSMVMGMPRIVPIRGRGQPMIGINSRRGGVCMPAIYLDGLLAEGDQITLYEPKDMRAVEVYNSEFSVPMGFNSRGCGVILFWSKRNPRW